MARRALKVCPCTGCTEHRDSCPELVARGRCTPCAQAADVRRGRRQARGYGAAHDGLRERLRPAVEAGSKTCTRCGQPIGAGAEWALDHTDDRTGYRGPSHATCNNQAGGRAAHGG